MSIIHEAIIHARFFRINRMCESVSGPVRQNFTRKKMMELLERERISTFSYHTCAPSPTATTSAFNPMVSAERL